MKKFSLVISLIAVCAGGAFYFFNQNTQLVSKSQEVAPKVVANQPTQTDEEVFSYKKDSLNPNCTGDSAMLCAVDFAVKCTINPDFAGCRDTRLPRFIFMEDENLERPTQISFTVHKIKPISADLIEIHTNSSCDGKWFGLCQGRVIYVLVPDNDNWRVKDIYAIEDKQSLL